MTEPARQTRMETEARETPEVAARLVGGISEDLRRLCDRLRASPPAYAITAGRGSSSAAALLAKYLFEERLGLPTASAAPSLQSIYGRRLNLANALVLAISQSGKSPDLVEFCRSATGPGVTRVGFINDTSSPLASIVDVCLPLSAGAETSVAATKSCLAAMTLVFGLVAHQRGDRGMIAAFESSPHILFAALSMDWSAEVAFLDREGPVYVVGRGPGLAIAKEAALKLKETCGLHAEAVSGAEIRHGPLSLAGPDLRIIVFAQRDAAFEGLQQLAADLRRRECPVLFISSDVTLSPTSVPADPEPVLELLAMLLRFYLFANAAALRRGRSPDSPPQLSKVTETR